MKLLPLVFLALIIVGFGLGCATINQDTNEVSPETETGTLNDINSTFMDENSSVEIGSMI